MTNYERMHKLAEIGYESALCAFGSDPDDMPDADMVWGFLLCNTDCIEDAGLSVWMQDSAPEEMPEEFWNAYDNVSRESSEVANA